MKIKILIAGALVFAVGIAVVGWRVLFEDRLPTPQFLDRDGASQELSSVVSELQKQRVIFLGEERHQYGHNLGQLSIVNALNERQVPLTIGLEVVQQTFQPALDAYIAGEIGEKEMLRQVEFFDRWRYHYLYYRPIFRYALEHQIPLVALNVPGPLRRRFSDAGYEGLSESELAQLPNIETEYDDDGLYNLTMRYYMRQGFFDDPTKHVENEENFLNSFRGQLLWDKFTATLIARYLDKHPEQTLLFLSGSGHLLRRFRIPRLLQRLGEYADAMLLPHDTPTDKLQDPDYLVINEAAKTPKIGRLGIEFKVINPDVERADNVARVVSTMPNGAADQAGIKSGDQILEVAGQRTHSPGTVRIELLDKKPGDTLAILISRNDDQQTFEVILQ